MYYEVRRSEELHSETVSGNREENRANFIDSEEFTVSSSIHRHKKTNHEAQSVYYIKHYSQ